MEEFFECGERSRDSKRTRKPISSNRVKLFGRTKLRQRGLLPYPACSFRLVIPRVDIFACTDPVADEVSIAEVTQLQIPNHPARSRIHIRLQLNKLLRQPLSQGIKRTTAALVTSLTARIRLHRIEGTIWTVDSIVKIAELGA